MMAVKSKRWFLSGLGALTMALLPLGVGASGTWTTTGNMTSARAQQTATYLFGGAVLVAGGVNCNTTCTALASAEVYNPATGKWIAVYPMTTPRFDHTATLLPNGQVLVAGGCSTTSSYYCANALSSAELYNPKTAKWTRTLGSMTTTRQGQSATLLRTGEVLIAGGQGCNPTCAVLSSAELYNPSTGTFTPTGSLSTARYVHTATLMTNGSVLVSGGANVYGAAALSSAEVYSPTIGTWTSAGSMHAARAFQTATLLTSGPFKYQVLVAGGYNFQNSADTLTSAEVYHP